MCSSRGRAGRAVVWIDLHEQHDLSDHFVAGENLVRLAGLPERPGARHDGFQLPALEPRQSARAEIGDETGIYTDARPPYGCLGLTLRR